MQFLTDNCESLRLISRGTGFSNTSPNFHIETVEIPAQRYEVEYKTIDIGADVEPQYKLSAQRQFWAKLGQIRFGTPFTWLLPIHSIRLGVGGGSPSVLSGATSGTYELMISGAPSSLDNWLHAGDPIKFADHTKIYTVAESVNTSSAGTATIKLLNPLKQAQPQDANLLIDNIEMTLIRDPDEMTLDYERVAGDLDYQSVTLNFIEYF